MAMTAILSVLVLGAFPWLAAPAQTEELAQGRDKAVRRFVSQLEEAITFCRRGELHAERKRLSDLTLLFDPNSDAALLGAGFRKDRSGEWVPPRSSRSFEDSGVEGLDEARRMGSEAIAGFVSELEQLLESTDLSDEGLEQLTADLARVDPRNEHLRSRRRGRGEVFYDGRWILVDSLNALDERRSFRQLRAQALATEARGEVQSKSLMGFDFQVASAIGAEVYVTGDAAEARELARLVDATRSFFDGVFDVRVQLPPKCRFFVLTRPVQEKELFLESHPAIGQAKKATYAWRQLTGIEGTSDWCFFYEERAEWRDAVVRMTVTWFLQHAFRVGMDRAWVTEGLGGYLTHALIGTRLTWFAIPRDQGHVLWSSLQEPGVDWMEDARALFADPASISLTSIMQKGYDQLTTQELLVATVLAAYLIEAQNEDLAVLLGRIGHGTSEGGAFQQELDLDLAGLPKRLARWLEERQTLPDIHRAFGSDDEVRSLWANADARRRKAVIADFMGRVISQETDLAVLVRGLAARAESVGPWPERLTFYDPEVHAPAQPIPRRRLAFDDPDLVALRRRIGVSGELPQEIGYDWTSGNIRGAPTEDLQVIFERGLEGIPPGLEQARAALLRELDGEHKRKEFHAFGHAYTDREGNVFSGITLYDVWSSSILMEMPDVDVLGIVHDLFGNWNRWKAPIPGTEHDRLYKRIGDIFQELRWYRPVREALADTLLWIAPRDPAFVSHAVSLHALWRDHDYDIEQLAAAIPTADPLGFVKELNDRCRVDSDVWIRGRRRQLSVMSDALAVRNALIEALLDAGSTAGGSGR